jgi:hypothetical protein
MSREKQNLIWYLLVLVLALGYLAFNEYFPQNFRINLANTKTSFLSSDSGQKDFAKKSEFKNAKLQVVFEVLVKSFKTDFDVNAAKVDFTSIFISEADLKTLGNIVTDVKRKEEERRVALYILSQIGESALSTLIMVTAFELPIGDSENRKYEIAFRLSALELVDKFSYHLNNFDSLLSEIQNAGEKQKNPELKLMILLSFANILERSSIPKDSFTENLF